MFSFVYNKGADYYDLYEYYNYDNDNDNDNDNENLKQQTTLKKIDSRICSICLEDTSLNSFYNYDLDTITHYCKCRPSIHTNCLYQCLNAKKKCVICGTSIDQMLTKTEKCIIYVKITAIYLLRFSLVTTLILCTYSIINIIFNYHYNDNDNDIDNDNEEL